MKYLSSSQTLDCRPFFFIISFFNGGCCVPLRCIKIKQLLVFSLYFFSVKFYLVVIYAAYLPFPLLASAPFERLPFPSIAKVIHLLPSIISVVKVPV